MRIERDGSTFNLFTDGDVYIGSEVWTAGKFSGALAWTFEAARAKSFTAA